MSDEVAFVSPSGARFIYVDATVQRFKFHASHYTSGVHYLLVKFDDGREIDVDLTRSYTSQEFGLLLGSIPDTIVVSKDLLSALEEMKTKNG
jgi:hypothetical protein